MSKLLRYLIIDFVRVTDCSTHGGATKLIGPLFSRFGIKAGIMSSAVYLTVDRGVWKDNERTTELYEELKTTLKPYVEPLVEQIPFEFPELPKTGDMVSTAKTTWNRGVMASCMFLIELPETTWDYAKRGTLYTYNKINDEIKSFREAQSSDSKY